MIILRKQTKSQGGQALIEALLALAFAVAIITAVVIVVINALNNTTFTKNQNLATQYAQEGLDIARSMKDSDYDGFKALTNGNYCASVDGVSIDSAPCVGEPLDNGNFSRVIYVNHNGQDPSGAVPQECETGSSFISSIVSWTDSKCSGGEFCHKIQLDSCFSDPNRLFGS